MSLGMNRTWILAALVPLFIYAGPSAGQNATLPGQEQLAKAGIEAGILERNDSQAIRYRSLLDKELRALIHE